MTTGNMSAAPALVQLDLDDYPVPREFEPPKEHSEQIPPYLSLFGPDSEYEPSDSGSDLEEIVQTPFVHLKDVINAPLSSLSSILEVLLPRLQPRPEVKGVAIEDQQNFICILVGELASKFRILHQQIDDPFLNSEMNRELHRQMCIRVCRELEQLYAGYIYKAAVSKEGIFSQNDNMSHMRAQLVIEADKRLNIPRIRREVLEDLRGPIVKSPVVQRYCGKVRKPPVPKQQVILPRHHPPTYPENLDSSLEHLDLQPFKFESRYTVSMPDPIIHRMKKTRKNLLPAKGLHSLLSNESNAEEREGDMVEEEEMTDTISDRNLHPHFQELRRVASLPALWGDFIICDLKYTTRDKRPKNIEAKEKLLGIHRPPSLQCLRLAEGDASLHTDIQMGALTMEDLLADLHRLVGPSAISELIPIEPEDSNPLLQAHVHGLSTSRVAKLAEYEANLRRRKEGGPGEVEATTSTKKGDSLERIPSVPTPEQLPYLKIKHLSGVSPYSNLASTGTSGSDERKHRRSTCSGMSVRSLHMGDGGGISSRSKPLTRNNTRDSVSNRNGSGGSSDVSSGRSSYRSRSVCSLSSQSPLSPTGISSITTISWKGGKDRLEEFGDLGSEPSPQVASGASRTTSVSDQVWGKSPDTLNKQSSSSHTQAGTVASPELAQPQVEVVSVEIYGKGVVRTAQVRVSERIPLVQLGLKSYGPIYNELAQHWESSMTDELDSNLNEGKDVSDVYKEIMESLPGEHLLLESDPMLEPSLEKPVDLTKIFASSSLRHHRACRVINKSLRSNITSFPWDKSSSRKKWEESGTPQDQKEVQRSSAGVSHYYSSGTALSSWKPTPSTATALSALKLTPSTVTALSALKPTPSTATPLSALKPTPSTATALSALKPTPSTATALSHTTEDYYKFVSRGETDFLRLSYHLYESQSDSEDDEVRLEKERINLLAKLRADERRIERYKEKCRFTPGKWNVSTAITDQFGGGISAGSSDDEADESLRKWSAKTTETIQEKLGQIWKRLHMSRLQQIDMAIKYCNISTIELSKVLSLWKQVCHLIEQREEVLQQLELFEQTASDPSRFFDQGMRGTAAVRLEEGRRRDKLHSKLNKLDKMLTQKLRKLYKKYGDSVTYKERLYAEKMCLDRTEMLYYLQQARRQAVLKSAEATLALKAKVVVT